MNKNLITYKQYQDILDKSLIDFKTWKVLLLNILSIILICMNLEIRWL